MGRGAEGGRKTGVGRVVGAAKRAEVEREGGIRKGGGEGGGVEATDLHKKWVRFEEPVLREIDTENINNNNINNNKIINNDNINNINSNNNNKNWRQKKDNIVQVSRFRLWVDEGVNDGWKIK